MEAELRFPLNIPNQCSTIASTNTNSSMVSTRRGAHTGPADDMNTARDQTLSLRKKPVRKATASKTATAKTNTEAPKKRPGRPKRFIEQLQEEEAENEEQDERLEEEPVKPARATRATGPRGRQEPKEGESSKPAEHDAKPTRKASTKKAKVEVQPDIPAAKIKAPALRATRATRATAARTTPLSPKKITQVSRAPARGTRGQSEHSNPTKDAVMKPVTRTRGKRRAVSNENEDIEMDSENEDAKVSEATEEDTMAPAIPQRDEHVRTTPEHKHNGAGSEAMMSSRPKTLGDSPESSSREDAEQNGSQPSTPNAAESGPEEGVANESEDELCGPKTPMKRSSPSAERRYLSSVQRTIRRIESEARIETPRPRPNVIVRRGGTPQTQKPYTRPAVPGSHARPVTVTRGSDRAFVFRPQRKASVDKGEEEQFPTTEEESIASIASPLAEYKEPEMAASSPVGSEPEVRMGVDDTESEIAEVPSFYDHTLSDFEMEDAPNVGLAQSDDEQSILPELKCSVVANNAKEDEDLDTADVTSTADPDEEDPDATVVIKEARSDVSEDDETELEADESAIIDDDFVEPTGLLESVPIGIQHEAVQDEDDSFMADDTEVEPQTLDWENLRQDITIPVNFEWHLTGVGQQQLDRETQKYEDAQEAMAQDETIDPSTGFLRDRNDSELDPAAAEEAFDELEATLNLSEFVDVTALAEPTAKLSVAEPMENEEAQASSVDISLSSHGESSHDLEPPANGSKECIKVAVDQDAATGGTAEELSHIANAEVEQTPAPAPRSCQASEIDISISSTPDRAGNAYEEPPPSETPHYAMPTLSFDARRKSLPASLHRTPVRSGARPHTSGGASISRLANPFILARGLRSGRKSTAVTPKASPSAKRSSTLYGGLGSIGRKSSASVTPQAPPFAMRDGVARSVSESLGKKSSIAATPERAHRSSMASSGLSQPVESPASEQSPTPVDPTPTKTPGERYPRSAQRGAMYAESDALASTAVHSAEPEISEPTAKTTPMLQNTPRERYPRSVKHSQYGVSPQDKSPSTTSKTMHSPQRTPQTTPREKAHASASPAKVTPSTTQPSPSSKKVTSSTKSAQSPAQETPQPTTAERFPRMNRQNYTHATTAAPPSRFRTPTKSPVKRPATAKKSTSLRKVALNKATISTPMKTPLKGPAETPAANMPMTPHPSAPLRGVLALVEIFTLEGASASAPFIALLHRLGARTTKAWKEGITHVVFKDGSPTTLQRVRLHNKECGEAGRGAVVHCVNSRWVSDCDAEGSHVGEEDEKYAVDVCEVPRGGKRRRKSMEPNALVNVNGNVVGSRRSSLGRSSLGMSPTKFGGGSPVKRDEDCDDKEVTPKARGFGFEGEKENWGEGVESPVTPDWIGAPERLVQQTAPTNRVRKLELKEEKGGSRRLTFWKGA